MTVWPRLPYTSPKPPSVATTPRLLTHNSRSNGSQHTSAMMALAAMAHRTKPAGASTTIAPLVDVANTIHGGPAVVGDDRCTLLVWNDLSVALIGARDGVPCAHPHALSLSITALREAGMRVHKGAHILATKLLAPRLLAEGRAWDATLAKTTIGWTERRDRPPFYHDIDPDPTLFAKEADIVRLDRPNTPFLALLAAHLRRWQQAYPQHADRWWWTLRLGIPHQSGRWFVHPTLTWMNGGGTITNAQRRQIAAVYRHDQELLLSTCLAKGVVSARNLAGCFWQMDGPDRTLVTSPKIPICNARVQTRSIILQMPNHAASAHQHLEGLARLKALDPQLAAPLPSYA